MFPMLLAFLAAPASACGGLFCDNGPSNPATPPAPPVVQAAERIVFAIDDGQVEVHVQVAYEGDPVEFGWVVPVPAQPELLLGNDALFEYLAQETQPTYVADIVQIGDCWSQRPSRGGSAFSGCARAADEGDSSLVVDTAFASDTGPSVTVVDRSRVGPYETVTLQASDASALQSWLEEAEFTVPTNLSETLAPYVADGSYFVALRLLNDAGEGDIAPLVMRYPGDEGLIPITLTAVAAADDMPIEVYVFGDHRAVPTNYLHVELNELAIDWVQSGANYMDVLSRAIDSAGSRAFVTELAGPPPQWVSLLPNDSSTEAVAARDRAVDLFDHAWLTRLSTTLSPSEMTVDPTFALNPDWIDEVDASHQADMLYHCEGIDQNWNNSWRELQLADGRTMAIASNPHLGFIDTQAATIASVGARGLPQVLTDNAEVIEDQLQQVNRQQASQLTGVDVEDLGGTWVGDEESPVQTDSAGCSTSASSPAVPVALGLLLAIALRRREDA